MGDSPRLGRDETSVLRKKGFLSRNGFTMRHVASELETKRFHLLGDGCIDERPLKRRRKLQCRWRTIRRIARQRPLEDRLQHDRI
jgi:hypothetical protein